MARKNMRKCQYCGKQFNILENDYIRNSKGVVELECYKESRSAKGIPDNIIDLEIVELLKITKEEKEKMIKDELEILKKKAGSKKREINRKQNLTNLINYFKEVYCVTVFPKYFYTKLAQINNGTYKGVLKGIPYEDLLEMFKIKQKQLDSISFNKSKKGESIKGIQRINYDIAILINKYDEYSSWKNKQKILASQSVIDVKKEENEIKIDYSKISNTKKEEKDMGIFDIVNDIY